MHPTQPSTLFHPDAALTCSKALSHADALLHCASAVAYESADQQHGQARHLALTVVHLVDMARALVVHSLEPGAPLPQGKAAEAEG